MAALPKMVLYRGCLFITYEVALLDKTVTIDTSAILKEKYKSYIYLKTVSPEEKENYAAGKSLNCFKVKRETV